jgi:hypothetical protein
MSTLKGRMTPLREANPEVPEDLAAIVAGLLEPDPTKRIADASQLVRDLARISAGKGWRWTLPDLAVADGGFASPASDAPHAQLVGTIDPSDAMGKE